MIAALLLVLQAAAPPPILIRTAAGVDTLPVTGEAAGGQVSAADVARALGGTVSTPSQGRVRLRVGETTFEFGDELPFVVAGDSVYPLAGDANVDASDALLPVHFVTEVLPRALAGYMFDAAARELRLFSSAARTAPGASDRAAHAPTPAERAPARPRERLADRAPAGPPSVAAPPARVPAADRADASASGARGTIVVDAGHGGVDGGMQGTALGGRTIREKDITLAVARELQAALRRRSIGVVMTRTRDTLIALGDRGRIANQRRGDLFISIHVNAANPRWADPAGARGFETYFLAEAKTEDARRVAQMENESVRFEGGPAAQSGDPLSFIITDMAQNEHLRESSELAARIQRGLSRAHPGPSRGVKQAGFKVLVSAFMPAVLVEIGFGTNPAEGAYIASEQGQREIAEAVADAAAEYLADYARRAVRGRGQ